MAGGGGKLWRGSGDTPQRLRGLTTVNRGGALLSPSRSIRARGGTHAPRDFLNTQFFYLFAFPRPSAQLRTLGGVGYMTRKRYKYRRSIKNIYKEYIILRRFDPINQGSRLFATPKPAKIDRRASKWAKRSLASTAGGFLLTKAYARWYDERA